MCDGHKPDESERHSINPDRFANMKGTGLPWYRVLAVSTKNYMIKARRLSLCCGNNGEPGC